MDVFDFIVIGAGSAGSVLADRLSAGGRHRVALLEAGPRDSSPFFHMPLGYAVTLKSTKYNWQFPTLPDPHTDGRIHKWPRGKALGGSSSINAMIYIRGNPADYDGWRQAGCTGWGASDVLPYFLRSEDYEHGPVPGHAAGGPLPVREPAYVHPLSRLLIRAFEAVGIPERHDFNAGNQDGAGLCQFTIDRGLRRSTARTFLARAEGRPNLEVLTGARVHRLLIVDGRVTGVRVRIGREIMDIAVRREVVLSAGAVNSPQILELSGIGDGERLKAFGIPVAVHLPGVGENLQDHYNVGLGWRLKPGTPSINAMARGLPLLAALGRYLVRRDGMMSVGPAHVTAFARTREGLAAPDIQFHATPASLDGEAYKNNELVFHEEPGITMGACVLRPESRGSIHLASPDPEAYPAITANYLATEQDRRTMIAGLLLARRVMAAEPMAALIEAEREPGVKAKDEAGLLALAREAGTTIYHPVGTCAMGGRDDAMAVLDPELRVRGIAGLRIADASVMPRLVSGNTNAPAIMIGEKAADLILGRTAPAPVEWPEAS